MTKSVIIDGVRYVPADPVIDEVRFYFMHDNHTFTRLKGKTIKEIEAHADKVEAAPGGSYGMLCPPILLSQGKEVSRLREVAHARGSKDSKDHWEAGKAKWRAEARADPDVMRLLKEQK